MIKNLLIFGSCVSRDIFNIEYGPEFKVVDYYARSSLASLSSEAYENDAALNRISSAFQRRMVANDFSKELLTAGSKLESCDVILIDLIDERFDLVVFPKGEIITNSVELIQSGLLDDLGPDGFSLVKPGSVERRELWLQGMQIFLDFLKRCNKLDCVLVNKVYWASRFENETDSVFPVAQQLVEKANQDLDWMYDALSSELHEDQFLNFLPEVLTSSESHRWGVSAFHYCDRYYKEALLQIINKQHRFRRGHESSDSPSCIHSPLISSGVRFAVSAYQAGGEVFAECSLVLDGEACDAACFSFYLLVDGVRHDVRWYEASKNVRFPLPEISGKLEVMAFYKDIFDETVTSRSCVN